MSKEKKQRNKVKPYSYMLYFTNSGGVEVWEDRYKCPSCGASLVDIFSDSFNFCSQCGVKIDKKWARYVSGALICAKCNGLDPIDGESAESLLKRVHEQDKKNSEKERSDLANRSIEALMASCANLTNRGRRQISREDLTERDKRILDKISSEEIKGLDECGIFNYICEIIKSENDINDDI